MTITHDQAEGQYAVISDFLNEKFKTIAIPAHVLQAAETLRAYIAQNLDAAIEPAAYQWRMFIRDAGEWRLYVDWREGRAPAVIGIDTVKVEERELFTGPHMSSLEQAYRDRQPKGTRVVQGNEWEPEVRAIWAYLDTLGKAQPDNRDEALRVAFVALWRIRWEAEGVSKVGAPWLRDTTNAALEKLKAMGVGI